MEKFWNRLIIPLLTLFWRLTTRLRPTTLDLSAFAWPFIKLFPKFWLRLISLLDKLISPFQSAFIQGRSMHENILLTHEIMHKFKILKTESAWVAIKLDIEKAYGKLEWDFILKCLQELGFHPTWISWTREWYLLCIPLGNN